jgi:hypothetical protein
MGLTQVQKYVALLLATLDGVTTQQRAIVPMHLRYSLSLIWTWTSTLAANVTLELSDNYNPENPSAARWTTITDPAVTTYLTTAAPAGGAPAGAAGSAGIQIDPLRCAALRITFDRTASSGVITVDVEVG